MKLRDELDELFRAGPAIFVALGAATSLLVFSAAKAVLFIMQVFSQ